MSKPKADISAQLGKSKTERVADVLHKAHDAAEIGKSVAPPGVRGRIQDAEDVIDLAATGVGIFARLKNIFRKQ